MCTGLLASSVIAVAGTVATVVEAVCADAGGAGVWGSIDAGGGLSGCDPENGVGPAADEIAGGCEAGAADGAAEAVEAAAEREEAAGAAEAAGGSPPARGGSSGEGAGAGTPGATVAVGGGVSRSEAGRPPS